MPRPKRKKQYYEEKNRIIYLLLHPETKEFYIGHTLAHNIRSTYKDHYIGAKYKTADMVNSLKSEGKKPCCFILDKALCTAVKAYRFVVVWTKIFKDLGYINLDKNTVEDYANDLLPENVPLYEERFKLISDKKITEYFSCDTCLFPDYGRQMCPYKRSNNSE